MENPTSVFIGYEISYFSNEEVISWAINYFSVNDYYLDEPSVLGLVSINTKLKFEIEKAGNYLSEFVHKTLPNFDIKDSESEELAKKYFETRLKEYLDSNCTPHDVCKMISPIEQIYDFPNWIGDMYNSCDWIEPETKPTDCRHLEADITNLLNTSISSINSRNQYKKDT